MKALYSDVLLIIKLPRLLIATRVFIFSLVRRVNSMETAIITTAKSLDEVLEKLNKEQKDHKIGKREMKNIFDNIVSGGEGMLD